MAKPFLRNVAEYLRNVYKDTPENICIVLPGKRAALFLKKELAAAYGKTIWLPHIITAEDLITEITGLVVPDEIDLLCLLYESYLQCYGDGAESFDNFARWGNLIIQDFNEIDRYMADPAQLYDNLKDIKEIENWSLGAELLTPHQSNYLRFMSSLGAIYRHYSAALLSQGLAYQGLAYRQAAQKIRQASSDMPYQKYWFCGFNALNEAELRIFKSLKTIEKAEFLWDADTYYLNNKDQEAGFFLRRNFEYLEISEPVFIESNLAKDKNIRVFSVPRQTGQAQVVKQLLLEMLEQGIKPDTIAVVLANEKLLWPVLRQIPDEVQFVNITMEYPLRYTSSYGLAEQIINIQLAYSRQLRKDKHIYHRDLLGLLRHPLLSAYLSHNNSRQSLQKIISIIIQRNLSFIRFEQLKEIFGEDFTTIAPLVTEQKTSTLAELLLRLTEVLAQTLQDKKNDQSALELEFLHILRKNFSRLQEVVSRYPHFSDLQSFRQLFLQTAGTATAPFIGEPLQGLQVMGVLETRTLDFEHVIMVNVNEGVLPAGKTINSFIPNDLKRAFGMPLYLEKDAIYAYHFYRLIQKAREIAITYDSETDTFGKGEKSRFVTQLLLELKGTDTVNISELAASPGQMEKATQNVIRIPKNTSVLESIRSKAHSSEPFGGLSPSGLIAYKECPLRFYFRYGAGLKENIQVEESAEAGTFGSILHLSLENLYKPFIEKVLNRADLEKQSYTIGKEVEAAFRATFGIQTGSGKLALQQEVIKVYVKKLMDQDAVFLKHLEDRKQTLLITGLEKEYTAPLSVAVNGSVETIYVRGKIDRIDRYECTIRIIDYKSSVKDSDKFEYAGPEILFTDTGYNKQLQLLMYAWLLHKNGVGEPGSLKPCIVPFKVFTEEPKYILSGKQPLSLSSALLDEFEEHLSAFISSILSSSGDFVQTEDEKLHEFCPYNTICNL